MHHHLGSHDPLLVALSVLIATLASYTALDLATRISVSTGLARRAWLATAAVAMGGGIWSMHFVAMLAFRLPGVDIAYDPTLTVLSLALPVVVTAFGFLAASRTDDRYLHLGFAGVFMGLGIVGMHYTGMAAIRIPGEQHHDAFWITVAVIIAIGAATVALWLAFQRTSFAQRIAASLVMGFAISGMHYSAMAGASFTIAPQASGGAGQSIGQTPLALWVAVTTILILVLALGAAINDRRFADQLAREDAERKLAREQLDHAREVLAQAQKMEAVGQLTGGVAHDFNNLLMIVLGNLALAKSAMDKGENVTDKLRRAIDNATRGAERAVSLTQRLLAFARQQPLSPKVVDLNATAKGAAPLLQRALGENRQLEVVTAAGAWNAELDPGQLEVALLNLAVNSRDAMPDGGKVTIEVANAYIDEAYAARHSMTSGQYVLISHSDTGCGMPPDTLRRAFEPFFTTKPVGQGTGLGLSQVFGFIKQSGGHVNIYSEVGQGTTVKMYFPRAYQEAQKDAGAETAAAPARGAGEHVLVVEDDADLRDFVVQMLNDLNYRTSRAESAEAALDYVKANTGIDLVITDVVMPGMNGRQLADAISTTAPAIKVIFMTGYSRNAIVHHGRLDPGVVLLQKPFTREELAARIRAVLGGS